MTERNKPKIDILEHGMDRDGAPTTSDKRLFLQLQVFGGCTNEKELIEKFKRLSSDLIDSTAGDRIVEMIFNLERLKNLNDLITYFRV